MGAIIMMIHETIASTQQIFPQLESNSVKKTMITNKLTGLWNYKDAKIQP